MDDIYKLYSGIPIVIASTNRKQTRTHKKKRINKKWAKRYGYTEYDFIEDGKAILFCGKVYVNRKTFEEINLKTK